MTKPRECHKLEKMLPEIKKIALKNESWKPYPIDPVYWVSDKGRIYSTTRVGRHGGLMAPYKRKNGYMSIKRGYQKEPNSRRYKCTMVHRMVLETFERLPKAYEHCNHIDGNPSNNKLENLEWCTRLENARHAVEILNTYRRGSGHGQAKFTEREAMFLCWLKGTYGDILNTSEIARFFGVADTTLIYLWQGKSWKHLTKRNNTNG